MVQFDNVTLISSPSYRIDVSQIRNHSSDSTQGFRQEGVHRPIKAEWMGDTEQACTALSN